MKRLSLAVVRANVSLLLERMQQVGEGAELACRRRGVAVREEVRERWGRRADKILYIVINIYSDSTMCK